MSTVVYYRTNADGQQVKVTRTVETKLVPLNEHNDRSSWSPYGEALKDRLEPVKGEEIKFRLFPKSASAKKEAEQPAKPTQTAKYVCKNCKADHLTIHCPHKNNIATMEETRTPGMSDKPVSPASRLGAPGGGPAKYVPPALRAAMGGAPGMPMPGMPSRERDVSCTLRVSNLPDTIREGDLRHNFGSVGRVTRCHVPTAKGTQRPRGFAFIEFETHLQADMARKKFDGVAVDNMIMHVEFAQPRE